MLLRKVFSFFVFAVILLFLASASVIGASRKKIWPGIGVNSPGLLNMYLGVAMPNATPKLLEAMAFKSMVDAHNNGISYFRVSVSGFGNSELEVWQKYPNFFWSRFDQMMNDLSKNGVKIIPVLTWWDIQFPEYAGEGIHALLTDPNSRSRYFFLRYIGGVVNRYKNHPAVLFWELSNEWNIDADLDLDTRSGRKGDNFTTDELLNFIAEYVKYIHELDRGHLISNGFSMQRGSAEHLRRQPEWTLDGPDWTSDSNEEYIKHLTDISRDVDIMSIHFYNFCNNADCTQRDNERFGVVGADNPGFLDEMAKFAYNNGKILFIGEMSDYLVEDNSSATPFTEAALERIGQLKIPFTALWAWEAYSSPTKPNLSSNIEPGFSDKLISKIREVNQLFFNKPAPEPKVPDLTPPIVIITSPLEGANINFYGLEIYALASDNDRIEKVEFWIENTFLGEVRKAPYSIKLPGGTYPVVGRTLKLKAKAFDPSGNSSESVVNVSGFTL